ncbi:hypothetical protein SMMN14_03866 [Sphaerulina musiva]
MTSATPSSTPPEEHATHSEAQHQHGHEQQQKQKQKQKQDQEQTREHADADQHEKDVEQREAYEYWGYLFKPDKTGTDKLKSLLRGLKDLMNEQYEPSDNPDLTPNQLAHFYRDLHGNYDQLFLGTPSESIAFIYKSLGCLHSLQPLHHTHQTAFTDPTVPALKTEGWIMWQTIQLLLGPEEHSSFLREAVAKWDVKDHDTGAVLPKILPRECFPIDPDKHMVAWYEGVSERLRREAEDEERHKHVEVEHDSDQPPPRRVRDRAHHGPPHGPPRPEGDVLSEDDGASVDSRGPALAYFRNPLYRHVDGRPSIVRKTSKRPGLSPRATMLDKGKAAAASFGRIARGVGSPHLWSAEPRHSRSHSRDHQDHHERRRSHADNRYPPDTEEPTSAGSYDERFEPRANSSHTHSHSSHGPSRHRRKSSQPDRAPSGAVADDEMEESETSPVYSPPSGSNSSRPRHHRSRPSEARDGDRDQPLRHSRSHDPTPSQREGEDYFGPGGHYEEPPAARRSSVHDRPNTPPVQYNDFGPSFGPSASPLFAATVARHPAPPAPHFPQNMPPRGPPGNGHLPPPGPEYDGGLPARHQSLRRHHDGYDGRSPARDDRHYGSPRPGSRRYDDSQYPSGPPPGRDPRDSRYPPPDFDSHRSRDSRDRGYPPPDDRRPPRDARDRDHRDRRSSRASAPPPDDDYDDPRRHHRPKHTRFTDTGVSGRKYPDESGFSRGS